MQMPFLVRSHSNGKTFELRIKHGQLPKPVYHTFDVREDAQRAGQRAIAALDRGEIPSWLERKERGALVTISQAIVAYRGIRAVPPSTRLLLDTLMNDVGIRPLAGVNYEFCCCHTAPVRTRLASCRESGCFHFMTGRHAVHAAVSWSPSTPDHAGNI
jgi:hypothetical protein